MTMGGLLDKANAASESGTDAKATEPEPVKAKATAEPAPTKSNVQTPSSGAPDKATQISLAGWVIILVGAILSLQGGAWGFAVVAVVVVLGLGAIVQADRMKGSISKPKLYITVAVALMVATGPYILVMVFPSNANVAVTDIEIDEANDELDFAIRGSFSSVDVEILSGSDVLWSGSAKMTSDIKRFNVPIKDFFDGNTEEFGGKVVKTYTISATSSNGNTVQLDVNSNLLVRQASTVASNLPRTSPTRLRTERPFQITKVFEFRPSSDCSQTEKKSSMTVSTATLHQTRCPLSVNKPTPLPCQSGGHPTVTRTRW